MKANPLPDMHYLKEAVEYDESSPSCLRWKNRPRSHFQTSRGHLIFKKRSSGRPAGSKARSGDGVEFFCIKINQVVYPAHRIVFAIVNGFDPREKEVDHKDRNPLNNAASNLRVATRQENARNKNTPANNRSGCKGVTWCKRTGKWMAQIGHNRKNLFLGRFESFQSAVNARLKASNLVHGQFSSSKI
jgi:hypothetical protein